MPLYMQIIGYAASILIPLAFLPQTWKIIKTKETKGVSVISYSVYFTGVITFLIYAILLQDLPMIICQTINGLFASMILSLTIYNLIKKQKGAK